MSTIPIPNAHEPSPPSEVTVEQVLGEMPPELAAKAQQANCTRCGVQIVRAKSMLGTIMVSYYVPALGIRQRGFLCGACGFGFREYLMPQLQEDATYTTIKDMLQAKWDRE
jgi:ribosomal protein L37E